MLVVRRNGIGIKSQLGHCNEKPWYTILSYLFLGLTNYGLYSQALGEGISDVLQSYKKTLLEVESKVIDNHTYTLSLIYR